MFDEYQVERMVNDIGDILVFLQHHKVVDYKKTKVVQLLDKDSTRIQFAKTEEMEVKRFIALVSQTQKLLQHIATHLLKHNDQFKTIRSDRIMGAVSYSDTRRIREQRPGSKDFVAWEMRSGFDTPANNLLALILISIVLYCEKYLPDGRLKNGGVLDSPTIGSLERLGSWATGLLKIPRLKLLLPTAVQQRGQVKKMLKEVLENARLGKNPAYYVSLSRILYSWKFYLWVAGSDRDVLRRALYYHFWVPSPMKRAQLYQAWVEFTVLRELVQALDLNVIKRSDATSFESQHHDFVIHFQKSYLTDLISDGLPVIDRPDISVEVDGRVVIVVDAKNSEFEPLAYREKMQSYIRSSGARFAVVVHSKGEPKLWREAEEASKARICWTGLPPPTKTGNEGISNRETMNHVIRLVRDNRSLEQTSQTD